MPTKMRANGLVVHSSNWGVLKNFLLEWNGSVPLIIIPTKMPQLSFEEIKKYNLKMVIFTNQALRASMKHMKEILLSIKQSSPSEQLEEKLSTVKEVFDWNG